ncbi:MAG: baseplate J/gp47 family protein [Clostridia bacterium]|nr:baseplate J/gp47 family protein [Clostridia bacterium]
MLIDITNIDTLIRGYITSTLQKKYPMIDTSENSPYDDLFIKPMIELLKPLIEKLNRMEIKSNLNNAEYMTVEELDEIGTGNYLLPRHEGTPATTTLTLTFTNINLNDELFSLKVPAGTLFTTSSGLQYQNKMDINITVDDLKKNYNKSKMIYEIDIPVESVGIGSKYNVGANEINTCLTPFTTALVGVTNKAPLTDGKDQEDNISYANRIREYYISRQLGTKPGYINFIKESFPEVKDVFVVGYGDKYMERDLLKIWDDETQTVQLKHVGGKVDIYIRGSNFSQMTATLKSNSNLIILPINYDDLYEHNNIKSNFTVYNLTDESKTPEILIVEKVGDDEYDGKYSGKVKIILDNDNNKSFNKNIVNDIKIVYTYVKDGAKITDEQRINIGLTKVQLATPIKGINRIDIADNTIKNIDDKYDLIQTGIIGTTDEHSEIVMKNIDDVPNGSEIEIQYTVNETLRLLGKTFNQDEFRIITTDILCREAMPVPVNIQFRVKLTNNRYFDDEIKSKLQASINSFFNTYSLGSEIRESDIVSWIYNDVVIKDYIQYIALPFDVFYIPSDINEEIPDDPNIIHSKDGVLPIKNIEYPTLNIKKFKVTAI